MNDPLCIDRCADVRPSLCVQNLSKKYGQDPVLADLSFSLGDGETLAVIGPSGCGKSTLLRLLSGLDKPDSGIVQMPDKARSAFILQDYGLFPWKTAAENVALPLLLRGTNADARQQATAGMLAELGLTGLENRYPAALSGGQRQRVAIGRALITGPDILLMDEPFSSLDAITREHLQAVMLDIWQRRRLTCVLVTHSVAEALFLGRYILVLGANDDGPARSRLWLDNPCFGDQTCRTRPLYAQTMTQIYAALKNVPRQNVPRQNVPRQNVPRQNVPSQSVPCQSRPPRTAAQSEEASQQVQEPACESIPPAVRDAS